MRKNKFILVLVAFSCLSVNSSFADVEAEKAVEVEQVSDIKINCENSQEKDGAIWELFLKRDNENFSSLRFERTGGAKVTLSASYAHLPYIYAKSQMFELQDRAEPIFAVSYLEGNAFTIYIFDPATNPNKEIDSFRARVSASITADGNRLKIQHYTPRGEETFYWPTVTPQ